MAWDEKDRLFTRFYVALQCFIAFLMTDDEYPVLTPRSPSQVTFRNAGLRAGHDHCV